MICDRCRDDTQLIYVRHALNLEYYRICKRCFNDRDSYHNWFAEKSKLQWFSGAIKNELFGNPHKYLK